MERLGTTPINRTSHRLNPKAMPALDGMYLSSNVCCVNTPNYLGFQDRK